MRGLGFTACLCLPLARALVGRKRRGICDCTKAACACDLLFAVEALDGLPPGFVSYAASLLCLGLALALHRPDSDVEVCCR
jgi:hypothetical protein